MVERLDSAERLQLNEYLNDFNSNYYDTDFIHYPLSACSEFQRLDRAMQKQRVMISLINNNSVRNGNADYWARLGAVLKENRELGISNEIYADLALPINNGAFFRSMISDSVRYFNLTDND